MTPDRAPRIRQPACRLRRCAQPWTAFIPLTHLMAGDMLESWARHGSALESGQSWNTPSVYSPPWRASKGDSSETHQNGFPRSRGGRCIRLSRSSPLACSFSGVSICTTLAAKSRLRNCVLGEMRWLNRWKKQSVFTAPTIWTQWNGSRFLSSTTLSLSGSI